MADSGAGPYKHTAANSLTHCQLPQLSVPQRPALLDSTLTCVFYTSRCFIRHLNEASEGLVFPETELRAYLKSDFKEFVETRYLLLLWILLEPLQSSLPYLDGGATTSRIKIIGYRILKVMWLKNKQEKNKYQNFKLT